MSQSRKKFNPKSNQSSKLTSVNDDLSNSSVLDRLDNLRTNVKDEHKKIAPPTRNNTQLLGAIIIIIIGMSGIIVLTQLNVFDNNPVPTGTNGQQQEIVNVAGGFKKDLNAFLYLVGQKVTFIYIGGEFCPYCGVERWAIVMALSEFGTFSGLSTIITPSSELSIPTYTFVGSSYSSDKIDFQPVEVYDNNQQKLETMSTQQSNLYNAYGTGSIPFMIIGGNTFKSGAGASFNANSFSNQLFSTIEGQVKAKTGVYYEQIKAESDNIVNILNGFISTTTTSTATTNASLSF